jgi:isoleucyl-tRNA synthetase
METARQIVELARSIRNETGIKTRQPLSELIVSLSGRFHLASFEDMIKDEINVKTFRIDRTDHGFTDVALKLNLKVAGKAYGKRVGSIQEVLKGLTPLEAKQVLEAGYADLTMGNLELRIGLDELLIEKRTKSGYASASGYQMTVALNTEITEELRQEGVVREVIRAIQDYRKKLDLPIDRRVGLVLDIDAEMKGVVERFKDRLYANVLLSSITYCKEEEMETVHIEGNRVGMLVQ